MESNKYNTHISVDCVVFGFDGDRLKILLIERNTDKGLEVDLNDKKLPGRILNRDEGLDDTATRVLGELTGLKNVFLTQLHSFGDPQVGFSAKDINWLKNDIKLDTDRIITVAYISLIKINRRLVFESKETTARWHDIDSLAEMELAFNHNKIANEALAFMRRYISFVPNALFELLPSKFTMTELRTLHDIVTGTESDARNFQKRMLQLPGLVPLGEVKKNVPHRAPKLYRFDKKKSTRVLM